MIAPIDGDWAYPNEQPDESSRSYATRMMQRGLDEMQADIDRSKAEEHNLSHDYDRRGERLLTLELR